MGRYRTINVDLNRQYRNDLNKNFEDIEKDIFGTESEIARIEEESKERDNLIAGTDVEAIIERIDTSADNADVQAQHAKTQGDYAKTQGDYAKSQGDYAKSKGDYANEKAILADQAAANASAESSNLSQLKVNVTTATQNANTATSNANIARTNANNAAAHATTQGDYAKREADRVAGMDVGQITVKVNEVDSKLTSLQQGFTQHLSQNKMYTTLGRTTNFNMASNMNVNIPFTNIINYNNADFVALDGGFLKFLKEGEYLIVANVSFALNGVGDRQIFINETVYADSRKAAEGIPTRLTSTVMRKFNTNDIVAITAYQSSGSGLDILNNVTMAIYKLG